MIAFVCDWIECAFHPGTEQGTSNWLLNAEKITLFSSKIDTNQSSFSDFSFVFGFSSFCSFVKPSLIP